MTTEPSGPPEYPLLGHLPGFLRDRLGFLTRCAARHGDVVKLNLDGPTYLLCHPDDIKHVLVVNPDNYGKSPRLTSPRGRRLSGEGLLTSEGPAHLRRRRLMQPAFHRTAIERFAETVATNAARMCAEWRDGAGLDIAREMMALAQRNILHATLGPEWDDPRGELRAAITIRKRYMEHVFFSPLPEWVPTRIGRAYRRAMVRLDRVVRQAIDERRRRPAGDILSALIQAVSDDGDRLTDAQLRDEALTLLITGYETIGEALAWTWHLLSRHPEAGSRLIAELGSVLGGRTPGAGDVGNLRYAWMALAESMRLYPPTWIFIRMARAEDRLPSGARIPAGAKIYLSQYVTHRDPRHWPDPERFDPERFAPEARRDRHPFAYFPFGGGPRVCIGEAFARMEGVLVLATVAQCFTLIPSPGPAIVPLPRMTLTPRNGIRMRLAKR